MRVRAALTELERVQKNERASLADKLEAVELAMQSADKGVWL